eukprot:4015173-Amphidinium_carterae.2
MGRRRAAVMQFQHKHTPGGSLTPGQAVLAQAHPGGETKQTQQSLHKHTPGGRQAYVHAEAGLTASSHMPPMLGHVHPEADTLAASVLSTCPRHR